jgi:hypothetical protein
MNIQGVCEYHLAELVEAIAEDQVLASLVKVGEDSRRDAFEARVEGGLSPEAFDPYLEVGFLVKALAFYQSRELGIHQPECALCRADGKYPARHAVGQIRSYYEHRKVGWHQ